MREKLLALAAVLLLASALSIHRPPAGEPRVYAVPVRLSSSAGVPVASVYPPSRYTGAGVRVVILDTGVDYTHPDLRDRVEVLASFTVTTGGRPLVFIVGVNGTLENARAMDEWFRLQTGTYAWLDENGHGTHVAGIIAGSGAASGGRYRGLAPNAKLWVVKVLGRDGSGTLTALKSALEWLRGKPVDVVCMALGFKEPSALPLVEPSIRALASSGVMIVAAAGNDGLIGAVNYPARLPPVYAITAVDRFGLLAPFSSMGTPFEMKPDFAALGVDVISTVPTYGSLVAPGQSYYAALSGTSMACAAAAGILTLWVEAIGRESLLRFPPPTIYLPANPLLPKSCSLGYGYLLPPP